MMDAGSSEKGGGKKKKKQKSGPLPETTRIRIAQTLEQFQMSDDVVYKFEDELTNHEREAVHILSRKMGLKSKSAGTGKQRRISIFKKINSESMGKQKEELVSFRFSEESNNILQDMFSRYPPNGDMTENKVALSNGKDENSKVYRDGIFSRPAMTQSEILNKVESLASRIEKTPYLREIAEAKSKLPIASFKDVITSTVESDQVVLICGETGCGKTTQVPQYLLDHSWSKGETCNIICTQPRRISATSVAERIASERGENIGDTVGYKIRLESKGGKDSSLIFCTNGVLLRIVVSKGSTSNKKKKNPTEKMHALSEITHIIVDEIHERDRFSDFMLAIIRDMLPLYPHLRLVLMSATIDAERFSKYFGECPVIRVPGFTYPVKTYYLEDALLAVRSDVKGTKDNETTSSLTEESKVAVDEAIDLALSNDDFDPLLELIYSQGDFGIFNYQHSKTGETPLMVFAGKGRVGDVCKLLSSGADCHLKSKQGKTAFSYAEEANNFEVSEIIKNHMEESFTSMKEEQKLLDKYLSNSEPEMVDCVLIEKLLRIICNESKDGAVLIFLPGWEDIHRTREKLQSSLHFNNPSKFLILALHSMVPLMEQKKVFKRPPNGCRKIVLSTNIAETSVTIDDVVYVIDSGRMKEKSYDPYSNVSTLHSSWVSKASAKQREGRAGRCQPGICYHLYSKLRAASLPDFQVPEIKRMPIEELCLQVKLVDPLCKIEEFLQKTLDPPVHETISNAISVLQDIGALTLDEKLTDLGEKLGSLPVHPLTSKMLFLGILLNCLDPALTLACAADYKDPFIIPMLPDEKKKANTARLELASLYGGNGDQLAAVAAFECWKKAKERGEQGRFCSQYFISPGTMTMISGMRKQLEGELIRHHFIPEDTSRCSLNAHDPGILHAVVFSGLYPMVGRMIQVGKKSLVETAAGNKVRLHQFSVNAKLSFTKSNTQPMVAFDEITRGDGGLHVRNCSVIGCLPLLLLSTEIAVAPFENDDDDQDDSEEEEEESYNASNTQQEKIMSLPENPVKVLVDRWLPFESTALDVAQIYCLRERLSAAILFAVTHPKKVLPEYLAASLHSIACILSHDGMSGISLPDSVDSLATMVGATGIGNNNNNANPLSQNHLRSLLFNQPIRASYLQPRHVPNQHHMHVPNQHQMHVPNQHQRQHVPNQHQRHVAEPASVAMGSYPKRPRRNRQR